ncbi:MAG TPA: cell envelope integrity protein CreD [Cytophagaceae bacterium]
MEKQSWFDKINNWAKGSVMLKIITIGILILVLLIPSSMLDSLIRERQNIRDNAISEVSSKWGNAQTIGGPVISIPFRNKIKNQKGELESRIEYAHFLPEDLKINGKVLPEKRYRGIYVVILYNTLLNVSGEFNYPDFQSLPIAPEDLMLKDAFLSVGITDMKGIKDKIILTSNGTASEFNPGIMTNDIFSSGISVPIDLSQNRKISFSFSLNLNGSSTLNFLPFGKETNVSLTSPWANPAFEGSFLPDNREVTDEGFTANWKILQLNRNYPQQGIGAFIPRSNNNYNYNNRYYDNYDYTFSYAPTGEDSSFGVRLLLPIDEYQKTNRSAKYNVMFIFITFLAFFFVEILNKKKIHPIQYLLVGFSICLFYILLLSISEHFMFDFAYLIASFIIVIILTLYTKAVLKNNFLTGIIFGVLTLLYGFFYSILQLQDYALLMGSLGLLVILASIMYLTRNIDWYNVNREKLE